MSRPPITKWWMESVENERRVREDNVRQEQDRVLIEAAEDRDRDTHSLQANNIVSQTSLASRTNNGARRYRQSELRAPTELDAAEDVARLAHPAPLLTPPASPTLSRVDTGISARSQENTRPGNAISRRLREDLEVCRGEISELRIRFQHTGIELRELQEKYNNLTYEHDRAFLENDERASAEKKAHQERVMKLMDEKNKTIAGLQQEIGEGKAREGELQERLEEAEGRQRARTRQEESVEAEGRRRVDPMVADSVSADTVPAVPQSVSRSTTQSHGSRHGSDRPKGKACGLWKDRGVNKGSIEIGLQILREAQMNRK